MRTRRDSHKAELKMDKKREIARAALVARASKILSEMNQTGYSDEVKRKFDLLTLEEKEIVRKALEEPYDKFISDELEKISQKVLAKD